MIEIDHCVIGIDHFLKMHLYDKAWSFYKILRFIYKIGSLRRCACCGRIIRVRGNCLAMEHYFKEKYQYYCRYWWMITPLDEERGIKDCKAKKLALICRAT